MTTVPSNRQRSGQVRRAPRFSLHRATRRACVAPSASDSASRTTRRHRPVAASGGYSPGAVALKHAIFKKAVYVLARKPRNDRSLGGRDLLVGLEQKERFASSRSPSNSTSWCSSGECGSILAANRFAARRPAVVCGESTPRNMCHRYARCAISAT